MTEHEQKSKHADEEPDFFDKPENVKLILRVFYVLSALLVVVDFIYHRHVHHPWEEVPAFYCLYGFAACVVLVLIATQMRKLVMRDEEYYDAE